jgi:hypothetical protein
MVCGLIFFEIESQLKIIEIFMKPQGINLLIKIKKRTKIKKIT